MTFALVIRKCADLSYMCRFITEQSTTMRCHNDQPEEQTGTNVPSLEMHIFYFHAGNFITITGGQRCSLQYELA